MLALRAFARREASVRFLSRHVSRERARGVGSGICVPWSVGVEDEVVVLYKHVYAIDTS